jgi:hypothetical protein
MYFFIAANKVEQITFIVSSVCYMPLFMSRRKNNLKFDQECDNTHIKL